PKPANTVYLKVRVAWIATAAQPSGSKLPRHREFVRFRTAPQLVQNFREKWHEAATLRDILFCRPVP
ncbi:hypothetical protein J7E47_08145, partial [Pseudomonas fluorescens]|nr:hypothetical protein [Pseudomonas fluorescens]